MFYKNFLNNDGLFMFSKYVFLYQVRHFKVRDPMAYERRATMLRKQEKVQHLSPMQDRLSLLRCSQSQRNKSTVTKFTKLNKTLSENSSLNKNLNIDIVSTRPNKKQSYCITDVRRYVVDTEKLEDSERFVKQGSLKMHTIENTSDCIITDSDKDVDLDKLEEDRKLSYKSRLKNFEGSVKQGKLKIDKIELDEHRLQLTGDCDASRNLSCKEARSTSHAASDINAHQVKHVKVESFNKVQHVLEKFPFPKSALHNFYHILSEQLKDTSLKLSPSYKLINKHSPQWICTINLKWPEKCEVTAYAQSKKQASHIASLKCLEILTEHGKISPDASLLIYTREDLKNLTRKKQTELRFDKNVMENMQSIIQIFSEKLRHFTMECNVYDEQQSKILDREDSVNVPKYLGMHHYLAKEGMVLPISKFKESFIELIQNNKCVIVKGEPGCGKSSRVPQYLLEGWVRAATLEDQLCRIAVTQPRRIAAISLAEHVASERNEKLGTIVGYQVRLKSNFQPYTGRILYCTTGILLRHLQTDPNLTKFSHVIIDEAHERDVNTDLLLNLLKKTMMQNDGLKVIVMSATIDADKFSEYFDGAPVFHVPGFTYPVTKHFLDSCRLDVSKTLKMCKEENPQVVHDDIVEILGYIHKNKPEGAILVFLPGWEDLVKVQKRISSFKGDVVVHLVHSKLKDSEQHDIFSKPPPGVRKIILATNIAETSITIDDVVYVVDTGIHKEQIFDHDKGISVIDMEWISKASAEQRAGRAGRCSPGEAYRLYTHEKFTQFPDYSTPKILNSSLTKVVLDSKMFSNDMDACEFMNGLITSPEKVAVRRAVDELKRLELLDDREKLTPLGRKLVHFQLEPNLAKVMVNAVVFKCTTPIVDIITLFSSESRIFGPLDLTDKESVQQFKCKFSNSSDHLALMRVYEKWLELQEEGDPSDAYRFCRDTNLVPHKLEFIKKLKDVHFGYLYDGLHDCLPLSEDFSDNDELVKAVLYSGTGTLLKHRDWDIVKNRLKTNVNVLVTRNDQKATITAESVNYKRRQFPSNFLVYINETRSNIKRTTTVRECSLIPAISVLLFSKELEILKADIKTDDDVGDNLVIISIKNTKLQFLCDKTQAGTLMKCKEAIDASYKYLIHQLTYANEQIPQFLDHWDDVLKNLAEILDNSKIE